MKNIIQYRFLFLMMLFLIASCGTGKRDEHAGHDQHAEKEIYTCPMHPEIIRDAPGSCPICGMDLVKVKSGNKTEQDLELETLLRPTNEFVVSTIPVIAIQQSDQDIEMKVVGSVDYDTRQVGAISSRVKGRIDRLYIRYKYQPIRKGQRVMDIYSSELVNAQQNLLFLLQNDPDNFTLIQAAKDRLLLMGMALNQVDEVLRSKTPKYSVAVFSKYNGYVTDFNDEDFSGDRMQTGIASGRELFIKEGMYVQGGQAVFSVYNSARAWILLDIYPEQQALIKTGNAVRIVPETAPSQNFRAKINYIEPIFRPGSKTLSARVYFDNTTMQLPIGSRVTATIFASTKNLSWLPKEAVIALGRNKIVFRQETGGFKVHNISTGIELNGLVQVISGLGISDSVARNAQFLIDNEAFIKVRNR